VVGKLLQASHQALEPQVVRVLRCVYMNLCDHQAVYFSTVVDEASRYACVGLIRYKRDSADEVCKQLCWWDIQTNLWVQRA
jgi:hypothetical protein